VNAVLEGLPDRVEVYDVGPRDGLQNEDRAVPVEVKAEFIRRLMAAGLTSIELTSFVPRKWVPQLGDAEELMALLGDDLPRRAPVLVPNLRGLERAQLAGAREVAVFASATETFARRNLNRSIAESLEMFAPVAGGARDAGIAVRGYVSMCFGDPWEGAVEPVAVAGVVAALIDMGCQQISLGDTIGVATPRDVVALLDLLAERGVPTEALAVHFHDTYGQALANTFASLKSGITTVDASAGGLGGCPYAGSATGNLATEDLVWQLNGLGIETGVDLPALVSTSRWLAEQLGRPSASRTVNALAGKASSPKESS
jgi:hydroxymethylglutaryl-CoA lyase